MQLHMLNAIAITYKSGLVRFYFVFLFLVFRFAGELAKFKFGGI